MVTGFLRRIDRVRYGPLLLLCAILSAGAAGLAYREFAHVVKSHFPSVAEEQRRFVAQIAIDTKVEAALERVLSLSDADRVVIWQGHNSTQDIAGIPFIYLTASFAQIREGVAWSEDYARPTHRSVFLDVTRMVWADPKNPKCVKRTANMVSSAVMAARWRERGLQMSYVCPMGAGGLVVLEYLRAETNRPADDVIMARLRETSAEVYVLLSSITTGR